MYDTTSGEKTDVLFWLKIYFMMWFGQDRWGFCMKDGMLVR